MAWPLLVTPNTSQSRNGGSLDVFDPVTKNKYTLSVQVPSVTVPDDGLASLVPHCSKNGWLIVSRGHSFFLVNPFKRGDDAMVVLPPVNELFWFKGISLCSTPGSPDFMVMIIEGISIQHIDTVRIRTWRPGQGSWEQHEDFDYDEIHFLLATHNPFFLDGEFYCMTRHRKLGAFNPKTMAWRVLDRLASIRTENNVFREGGLGEEGLYMYPVEWKGEVVAVFHDKDVEEPIEMFRLDRSRMAWEKLEDLQDGAMFWDRKQVIARPSSSFAQNLDCNKLYVPAFIENT
ncbi:F-box/kelch-repeat protein At3g18720 [Setaria viridis]|nr:F-box/kelch-repeat protein At1g57790-like [Setaria viridis]